MLGRSDDHEFVAMNQDDGQPGVGYRQGNDAEVDGVIDYRFQNLGIVGALDIHADIGVLLFELGENFGQDVQARALVGSDDNLASGHALGFGDGGQHGFAGSHRLFGKFLEKLCPRR